MRKMAKLFARSVVLLSVCYVAILRVLQPIFLLSRSAEFKELEIVVLRHELTVLPAPSASASIQVSGPVVLGGGQPDVATGPLVVVFGHAINAALLAQTTGDEPLDVRATAWAATDCS